MSRFKVNITQYRISSIEHKFESGDWVRIPNTNQVKLIDNIVDDAYYAKEGYIGDDEFKPIELWQPQVGEFVVLYNFADGLQKSFRVAQFKQVAHGKGREGQYKDMQGNYFTHCEPFKGTLPTFIKDK